MIRTDNSLLNQAVEISVQSQLDLHQLDRTWAGLSHSNQTSCLGLIMRTLAILTVSVLSLTAAMQAHTAFSRVPVSSTTLNDNLPSLAPVIKKVGASVVSIAIRAPVVQKDSMFDEPVLRQFFGLPGLPQDMQSFAAGSGVVFDGRLGLIVTNSHVVENAEQITVTLLDGREVPGILQGSDPDTDVAIIKVPLTNLPSVAFANSDSLEVGDYVLAIGNPFGIGQTVTSGIVSGLRRTEMGLERYEDFIQTDASINPGNSGGALVNLRGELVGINAAIVGNGSGNAGIGFAIPINMVRAIADQLVKYGSVERGELGWAVATRTADIVQKYHLPAGQMGAVVTRVDANSAAELAGSKTGDLVTALNGSPVRDAADLRNKLGLLRVGDVAEMAILRSGKSLRVQATLTEPAIKSVQGGHLTSLFEGALFTSGLPQSGKKGVQVLTVNSASEAWHSGLREDDLITAVNHKKVAGTDEFETEVAKTPDRLVLDVIRNGESLVISMKINGGAFPNALR
jgi:Do/DeqQ family serine protease